jgi:negative regulator of genetic competence, sporulation and motility
MEFILINENKIKVMLSSSDLEEFEIEADELDYANTDTKRMFWDILSRAKHSTGFDTDGQRVLVQLYPSRQGGCEMFVTKIGGARDHEESNESNYRKEPIISEKITVKPRGEKGRTQKSMQTAYGFDELSFLLSVCRQLFTAGYIGESSAFIGDNEKFYLFLSEPEQKDYLSLNKYSFINEFGKEENRESTRIYLHEHGKVICRSDAVALLSKL